MSPVDFKKWPCHPVEFKGQGPPRTIECYHATVDNLPLHVKIGHFL